MLKSSKVLVIGDLILDEYVEGKVERISPEAPVPVVDIVKSVKKPGGSANVAGLLKEMGAKVWISGVVGEDKEGKVLLELLKGNGINCEGVVKELHRPTTLKTRVIARSQHLIRLDREKRSKITPDTEQKVKEFLIKLMPQIDAILVEDYDKGFLTPAIISLLKYSGKPVYVDPKYFNIPYYTQIHFLKPNFKEFKDALGIKEIKDLYELYSLAYQFKLQQQVEILMITMGPEGAVVIDRENRICRIPAIKREVYDVTGAGDMVIAAYLMAELSGYSLIDAAVFSIIAAGIEVGKLGATPVSIEEIKEVWNEEYENLKRRIECISL